MSKPLRIFAFVSLACIAVATSSIAQAAAPSPFDPKPWLEDLEQVRESLSTKYANLEWAVLQHEIDLTTLFNETKAGIASATSDTEARASFDRLAHKLGDGHVRFRWSVNTSSVVPNASCEALGYDRRMQGQPVAALPDPRAVGAVRGELGGDDARALDLAAVVAIILFLPNGRRSFLLARSLVFPLPHGQLSYEMLNATATKRSATQNSVARMQRWDYVMG